MFFFFFSDPWHLFGLLMFCMTLDRPSFSTRDCTETLWVSMSIACWLRRTKSYKQREKHLSPLWARTRERNITVVKRGARVVGGTASKSPSYPAYANKQPTVPFRRVDFAWTYLLIVIVSFLPAPSGERVSKHVPLPSGPAVNQRLKDAKQKEGKRAVRKVKKSRVKFESIEVETERTNRQCLSSLLLIFTAETAEIAQIQIGRTGAPSKCSRQE